MSRLHGMRGYLGGAMDKAPDAGVGWRQIMVEKAKGLGIIWLDPTNKPIDIGVEDVENMANRKKLKALGDYDLLSKEMKVVRCVDLRMVDICDFLVVNLDVEIHTCGTYEEIFLANRQKKPIILHVEQGKMECPDWLFATLPHQTIFSTWKEVMSYLDHVAYSALVEHHKRWYFFNFPKVGVLDD